MTEPYRFSLWTCHILDEDLYLDEHLLVLMPPRPGTKSGLIPPVVQEEWDGGKRLENLFDGEIDAIDVVRGSGSSLRG